MNLKEFLLTTLFPPHCLSCSAALPHPKSKLALCESCLGSIVIHQTLFCIRCRARLAENARVCHRASPLRLASIGRYRDPSLRLLITRLKYRRQTSLITTLSLLINRYLDAVRYEWNEYVIIPLPLHAKKERQRGFNQSLLIAEAVATHLHLPLLTNVLYKIKPTLPQAATKDRTARTHNLEGCFAITHLEAVHNKKVIVVDDVCTTGTTLIEAAETLKQYGAKEIIGFVIAQTD